MVKTNANPNSCALAVWYDTQDVCVCVCVLIRYLHRYPNPGTSNMIYYNMFTVCADVDALELVLNHGGTTSSADVHGGYAIHYAAQMCGTGICRSGDVRNIGVRVLQLLLTHGADVHVTDKHGRQPILWAASAGKVYFQPFKCFITRARVFMFFTYFLLKVCDFKLTSFLDNSFPYELM